MLAIPPVLELDIVGPWTVFAFAAKHARSLHAYRVTLASTSHAATIETDTGLRLSADCHYTHVEPPVDTLLIAGGSGARQHACDDDLSRWLRGMHADARRVGSICTGAFVLASAGLLDRRRATTHWQWASELAARYPHTIVDPHPIWIREGKTYTSAGVTAGIDLALALVEEDLGAAAALDVARMLVVFLRRPGSQPQISVTLAAEAATTPHLRELQAWIADNFRQPLTVDRLASRVAMSPRNFSRAFKSAIGVTPARYVRRIRIEAARRLLEQTSRGVDDIARVCGFGGAEVMRRAFIVHLGTTPRRYVEAMTRARQSGTGCPRRATVV